MTRSDTRNKEIALGRIKRLASSGLPLEPLVRSVFELINDAVPNSPNKVFHVGGDDQIGRYLGSSYEIAAATPTQKHFFADSPPEVSGSRFRYDDPDTYSCILPSKSIWTQAELTQHNWYRADGYNVVYRPLGWHEFVEVVFEEAGGYLGHCPVWRTVDQKPFSCEAIEFLRASAPHISHGLKSARLLANGSQVEKEDGFAPLATWGSGVILLDEVGHPIAMDAEARLTFQQTGIFDGISSDAFESPPIRTALDYVMRTLKEIFHEPDGGPFNGAAPVYRLYHHWTGIVLKLRGVRMASVDGREYTTILVERGETVAARQRRLQFRWGLSDREAEVLALIGQGKTGPEISILLSISHDTARKHLTHVFEKLGVENRTEAALLARDAT
jgi:DNA-binding CsgD family transcriptional regulator